MDALIWRYEAIWEALGRLCCSRWIKGLSGLWRRLDGNGRVLSLPTLSRAQSHSHRLCLWVGVMTDWRTDFKPSFDERHTVYRSMTDWRLNFSNSLYRELVGLCCLVMSRYQSLRHQSVIKVLCVWITADDGLKSVRHCIIIFDVLGRFWAIALC